MGHEGEEGELRGGREEGAGKGRGCAREEARLHAGRLPTARASRPHGIGEDGVKRLSARFIRVSSPRKRRPTSFTVVKRFYSLSSLFHAKR